MLVRAHGFPREGRGCLTHWLKGRAPHELAGAGRLTPGFIERAFAAFESEPWSLADSIVSVCQRPSRYIATSPLCSGVAGPPSRIERWRFRASTKPSTVWP